MILIIFLMSFFAVESAKTNNNNNNNDLALNISKLLDKLLTNYSKSLRPNYGTGVPTIVLTNININSLGPISNFEMTYSMDCYFRQEWKDDRLAFDAPISEISLSMKMLELIWKPDTYFLNGKDSYLHKIPTLNRLVRLKKDGSVLYSQRLTIKASCPMDLSNFPLDKQICPLWIGSFSYPAHEVLHKWKEQNVSAGWFPIQIDDGVKLSQFDLLGTDWNSTRVIKNEKFIYRFIGMDIILKRHMGYYLLQVYVPCIMLVILSWVSFFINREATSDRTCIGIMCVLSLVTLSFDVRNDIPEVPYATALDWFLIMCYLFIFASLLEFTGVHYFTKVGYGDFQIRLSDDDEDKLQNDVKYWDHRTTKNDEDEEETSFQKHQSNASNNYNNSNHFELQSSIIGDSRNSIPPIRKKHKFDFFIKLWNCIQNNPKYKQELTKRAHFKGINSVSKCDKISRIIFPTSFFLLNILYWYSYYDK